MIAVIVILIYFAIQAAIAWSKGDDSGKWLVIIVFGFLFIAYLKSLTY